MKSGLLDQDIRAASQLSSMYKPSTWLAKIAFMNHLLLFNNVLTTILSEKSGGKSSFATLLIHQLDPQIQAVFLEAHPPCDRTQVLRSIAERLQLNIEKDLSVLTLVAQVNEQQKHVLVAIDDAHNLSESLIKEFLIAIQQQETHRFFHLCFIADYSLMSTLNKTHFDSLKHLLHTIEPAVLHEDEARTYVLQRAMDEQLVSKPLTEHQLRQFFQLTQGNIARINQQLESFIVTCSAPKKRRSLAQLTQIIVPIMLLLIGAAYYVSRYDMPSWPAPRLESQLEQIPDLTPIVIHDEEPVLSVIPPLYQSARVQWVHAGLPVKPVLDDEFADEAMMNFTALIDKVIVIPTVQAVHLQQKKQEFLSQLVSIPPIMQHKEQSHASALTSASKTSPAKKFTIQLLAGHNFIEIKQLKKISPLYSNARVRHFTDDNGHWYVVTLGEFSSLTKAQEHLKQLPMTMSHLKPWVRPLSHLEQMG